MPFCTLLRRARATVAAIGAAITLVLTGGTAASATGVERIPLVQRQCQVAPVRPPLKLPSLAQNPATAWKPPRPCAAPVTAPTVAVAHSSVPERRIEPGAAGTTGQGSVPVTRAAGGLDGGAPVFAAGTDGPQSGTGLDTQARRDLAILTVTVIVGLCLALAARRMRAGRRD